jgi:hypothetical protein
LKLAFPAGCPSLDLNKPSPTSWDEVIASEPSCRESYDSISTTDKTIVAGSIMVAIAAFSSLLAMSSIGCVRYFMAGGVCAAVSHAIPTPVDVVKVSKISEIRVIVYILKSCISLLF